MKAFTSQNEKPNKKIIQIDSGKKNNTPPLHFGYNRSLQSKLNDFILLIILFENILHVLKHHECPYKVAKFRQSDR